jgi:predicted DNA-binding transcriptional regulator AlpA
MIELLTIDDVATLLKCKRSSVHNMTRKRGQARYEVPLPVQRLPCGLRFRRSDIENWLDRLAESELVNNRD